MKKFVAAFILGLLVVSFSTAAFAYGGGCGGGGYCGGGYYDDRGESGRYSRGGW